MKLIFKLFIAVLAGILISYVALIDSIVEQIIEQEGSKAIKARLEIGEAEFHLFPPSLTLYQLAATNPQDPLRNIISSSEITAQLNNSALFDAFNKKALAIDSVTVRDLRFQHKRKHSGAIEGLTPAPASSANSSLPIATSDASSLIENAKQSLQDKLDVFNKQAADIKTQWQQQNEAIIRNNKFDTFKQRWTVLQNAGTTEKLNGLRQLKKDISAELTAVTKIREDLQIDIAVADEIEQQAKQLINSQAHSPNGSATQTSAAAHALTDKLLADKLKNSINELLAIYQSTSNHAPSNNAPAWPVLIKQLTFNGQIELGATSFPIEGNIQNLSNSHSYWQLPTTISATQSATADGKFSLAGNFDHRNPQQINDNANLSLSNVNITALSLSRAKDMRVVLGQADASVNGKFSLTQKQIVLQIDNQFKNAQLTIETNVNGSSNGPLSNNVLAANLSESLRSIDRFDVTISAQGDINNIALNTSSSLDPLFESAANQLRKTAQDAIEPQLRAALQNTFEASSDELKATQQQLDDVNKKLNSYQRELSNLMSML